MTYPIIFFRGHALLPLGPYLMLIATGSPMTFHRESSLELAGRLFSVGDGWKQLGIGIDCLSDMLEHPITTLLGMDILSQFEMVIDYPNATISLYADDLPSDSFPFGDVCCHPLQLRHQVPVVAMEVAGRLVPAFLDTGSAYSYVPEALTMGQEAVGEAEDFYPLYGCFSTLLYDLPTHLGNTAFRATYGNLPSMLAPMMPLMGANSILGYDFFRQHKVWLSPSRGGLYFQRVGVQAELARI